MKSFTFTLLLFCSIHLVTSQNFNQEATTAKGAKMLLGKINQKALQRAPYKAWFQENKVDYIPQQEVIAQLRTPLASYTITAFMGTWCGDSKREVPRFYKVLEAANFPMDRFTLIAVDRKRDAYKKSPGGEQEGLHIHRVPTFIFYKNGKEVNRITESPVKTLEEDILHITKGNYKGNYHAVSTTANFLDQNGAMKLKKKEKSFSKLLKKDVQSYGELSTYVYILSLDNHIDEAIAVAKLNSHLFPEEARTHSRLASMYELQGNFKNAIKSYSKAAQLDPTNEDLQTKIAALNSLKDE